MEIQQFSDDLRRQLLLRKFELSNDDIASGLVQENGRFVEHEGELWDFKESWPFSHSDEYFMGLVKLVVAFSNNIGGVIIFNVVDENKSYRKSKVIPNPDKFINAVKTKIEYPPEIEFRCFHFMEMDLPTVVIFPKRQHELPSRLQTSKNGLWYIREGYEKVEAKSSKIPALFCRKQVRHSDVSDEIYESYIPSSPGTLPKFVRRFSIMEKVFDWLHNDRNPRCFLYGRGGSGKTTIAYEIARHISEENIVISESNCHGFEVVIFVSAKRTELNVYDLKAQNFLQQDFEDTDSFLRCILTCSSWYIEDDISDKSTDELLEKIEELFNEISVFIVVDDIDTLTTEGIDGAIEDIFVIAARAKRPIKLLYTLRNVPTNAIKSGVPVPGLKNKQELLEFIELCSQQFRVQMPNENEIHRIVNVSEGRPLSIESIIALRRTTESYERAINAFENKTGDDARRYVFQREWDALSRDNRSRNVLAVLALMKSSASAEDIRGILNFDFDGLQTALSEILEMFVDLEDSAGETKYKLGSMTRRFVIDNVQELPRFEEIKRTCRKF